MAGIAMLGDISPRCLARENIACDVDEVLWPDQKGRDDAVNYYVVLFVDHYMCNFVLFVMYTV